MVRRHLAAGKLLILAAQRRANARVFFNGDAGPKWPGARG